MLVHYLVLGLSPSATGEEIRPTLPGAGAGAPPGAEPERFQQITRRVRSSEGRPCAREDGPPRDGRLRRFRAGARCAGEGSSGAPRDARPAGHPGGGREAALSEPDGDWKQRALDDFGSGSTRRTRNPRSSRKRTRPTVTCAICSPSSPRYGRRFGCRTGSRPGRAGSWRQRRSATTRPPVRRRAATRRWPRSSGACPNGRGPLPAGDPGGARRPGARPGRGGPAARSAAPVRAPAAGRRGRRRRLRAGARPVSTGCCPASTCGRCRPWDAPSTAGSCMRWRRAASTESATAS